MSVVPSVETLMSLLAMLGTVVARLGSSVAMSPWGCVSSDS